MKHYRELAFRYLTMNRRRSIVTILGVTMSVIILYSLLNLGWSALLKYRENIRAEKDYEIILFTETKEQIEEIMADSRVKSAYVGPYYDYDRDHPVQYANALYINTSNPYRMDSVKRALEQQYGVAGTMNYDLEIAYMQGTDKANLIFVSVLSLFLISLMFAFFGIGIIRNSIQLSNLEQIKDYGNLRCIGATKGQLKAIVYLEGTILEGIGVAIGILIGVPVSRLVGYRIGREAGFHLLPVVPIITAFLFDLYFAMEENCKVVANLTPVSAIRGEYRIRKEKLKLRRSSVFGKLFGIEGDYAYKSIMRNPLRFLKTVSAVGIGIAATITTMGFVSTMNGMLKDFDELFKYYKISFEMPLDPQVTIDEQQSWLPDMNLLQAIADMEEVDAAKRIYSYNMLLVNPKEYYGHLTETFRTETEWGAAYEAWMEQMEEDSDMKEWEKQSITWSLAEVTFTGYDEEDYARYESALIEGTLDIGENGVVLINGGEERRAEQMDSIMDDSINKNSYMKVTYTDYQIGDTIDVIDMVKYRSLYEERQEALLQQYKMNQTLYERMQIEPMDHFSDEEWEAYQQYSEDMYEVGDWVWEQLLEEGAYKTYTIEGIVEDEVNRYSNGPVFILPLEQYFAATATDESMIAGMNYHFKKFSAKNFYRTLERELGDEYNDPFGGIEWDSPYPEYVAAFEDMQGGFRILMLVAGFIVMMSTFNILNTTASNLHLRRKEFAQLRVIGVSGRQLMRMVMLEGIISTLVANLVGIVTGVIIHRAAFDRIYWELYQADFRFPLTGALLGLLVSSLILCGSIYIPLRSLKLDMAGDLATGGE